MSIRKAFTLVELLVVIAIIAVLLAILLPSLKHVKELALRIRCGTAMRGVGMAIKFYADNYDGKLMPLGFGSNELGTGTIQHPFWAYRYIGSTWSPMALGSLHKAALIENPSVFYCPADPRWKDIMKVYTIHRDTGATIPWGAEVPRASLDPHIIELAALYNPALVDSSCVRVNTAYQPQSRKLLDASRVGVIQRENIYEAGFSDLPYKLVDQDSSKANVSDNGGHAIGGTLVGGEKSKGQNALFGDGHVVFGTPPRDPHDPTITYRIRQEGETIVRPPVSGKVAPMTTRYFFYLQP